MLWWSYIDPKNSLILLLYELISSLKIKEHSLIPTKWMKVFLGSTFWDLTTPVDISGIIGNGIVLSMTFSKHSQNS